MSTQNLANKLKPYILKRGSVMYRLVSDNINAQIKSATSELKKYHEKYGKII